MLGRLLLAGMATFLTLSAADLEGNWVGIMVLDNRASRVSLSLHEHGRSLSGAITLSDDEPARIRHAEIAGDLLAFTFDDAPGSVVKFRLKVVDGLLVGRFLHRGEALSGEAQFANRTAEVMLPFHNACTTPALLLRTFPAEYSKEARGAQLEGTVFLAVRIDVSGQPVEVHVLRGLGMGLDEKAVEALKKWEFQAASRQGTPVPFETVVAMRFRYF